MTAQVDLSDKHILVTGGSMGLGYAAAIACLEAGAHVAICARGRCAIDEAVAKLIGEHEGDGRVIGLVADVTEAEQVSRAMDTVNERWGNLHGVIHAAGIYGPIGRVIDIDSDAWMDVLRINLFGSFLVIQEACRRMVKHGGGRIAVFAGGGAASPFPNYSGYASSKVAVVRLTETVALEMQDQGVAINCIAPGFVLTRLHEQTLQAGAAAAGTFFERTKAEIERGGVPASVGGRAAAFLVSDNAAGITGKFVAAPYDNYAEWSSHLDELRATDVFTLRRIVPRDRGSSW